MEAKILSVLKAADRPLTAVEISKKIECSKKEVNQVIYKIDGVSKKPGTQPPQWLLKDKGKVLRSDNDDVERDSTDVPGSRSESRPGAEVHQKEVASLGASPCGLHTPSRSKSDAATSSTITSADTPNGGLSDSELCEEIMRILQVSSPQSAPQISKKIPNQLVNTSTVKRRLYEMERKGDVENTSAVEQKPLWKLKKEPSGIRQAKLDNQPLYKGEFWDNGVVKFIPVDSKKLIDSATKRDPKLKDEACLPTLDCADGNGTRLPDRSTDRDEVAVQEVSGMEPAVHSLPSSKKKSRIKLAPNFGGSVCDGDCEERVLKLLRAHPGDLFSCSDVREQLRMETRDKALVCLLYLVERGLVCEEERSESSDPRKFQIKPY